MPFEHRPTTTEEASQILARCGRAHMLGAGFLASLEADPEIRLSKPICKVMVLMIRHQLESLDAAVALTKYGRPQFVSVLTRGTYETYLNILAIGWLRQTIGRVTYKPSYSARRFIAFWNIASLKQDRDVERSDVAWLRLGMDASFAMHRRRLLRRRALAAQRTYFGFSENSSSWFHASFKTLFEALWKDIGTQPCFPPELFPLPDGFADWQALKGMCWGRDSNQVHASIMGLTSRPDDRRDVWPSLNPVCDYTLLDHAWMLSLISIRAAAAAIGRLELFDRLAEFVDKDPISSLHYLR